MTDAARALAIKGIRRFAPEQYQQALTDFNRFGAITDSSPHRPILQSALALAALSADPPVSDRERHTELDRLIKWRTMVLTEVSVAHDLPPSHDTEPLLFHQGWEACARYIMKVIR